MATKAPARLTKSAELARLHAPAPRQTGWWLLKEKAQLTPEQQDFWLELSQVSPAITQELKLVQEFRSLMHAGDKKE